MKIHHIGIIVKDLIKSITIYEKLGYNAISEVIIDNTQYIKVCFLKSADESQVIELIEAISSKSTVFNFKYGYNHICYEVNSQENFLQEFKNLKIGKIVTPFIKASAIDNKEIIFAYLHNDAYIEFIINE